MGEYDGIVEVVEARVRQANDYLSHGYKLLGVQNIAGSGTHPDGKQYFVRRMLCYVVGRTEDVPHYEPQQSRSREPAVGSEAGQ